MRQADREGPTEGAPVRQPLHRGRAGGEPPAVMPASESQAADAGGQPASAGRSTPAEPIPGSASTSVEAPARRSAADRRRLALLLYGTALAVYLLDRLTKYLVSSHFHQPTTLI